MTYVRKEKYGKIPPHIAEKRVRHHVHGSGYGVPGLVYQGRP